MRSVILPGQRTEAYCDSCQRFQAATYDYGSIPLGDAIVDQVMRATCDHCGEILEVAQQSAHRLREARPCKSMAFVKKNVRIPRPLKDYADSRVTQAGLDTRTALDTVLRAMLRVVRKNLDRARMVQSLACLEDPILRLKRPVPATVLLSPALAQELEALQRELGASESEVIRRLLVASEAEPQVDQEILGFAAALRD